MKRALFSATSALALLAPCSSMAQDGGDVIVMRRVLQPGTYALHSWQEGPWTSTPACADHAVETRTVSCVETASGRQAPDTSCRGRRPDTEREIAGGDHRTCSYEWKTVAGICTADGVRDVSATCVRSGGTSATTTVDGGCSGPRPTSVQDDACLVGTWVRGDWGWAPGAKTCSHSERRVRTATCTSTSTGRTLPDAQCPGAAGREETTERLDGCAIQWVSGGYGDYSPTCSDAARRRQTVQCQISGDGITPPEVLPGSRCDQGAKPPEETAAVGYYEGCNYSWRVVTSTCDGNGTREQTYACQRTGGDSAPADVTDAASVAKCGTRPPAQSPDGQCGSPSLIVNGGFENDFASWERGTGSISTTADAVNSGTKAASVNSYVTQRVTLQVGRSYTLSFWSNGFGERLRVTVYADGAGTDQQIFVNNAYPKTTRPRQMSLTFTAQNVKNQIYLDGRFLLDDVTLKAN